VYLDPPYYAKADRLYKNYYKHGDHAAIATLVKEKIKIPWIVSYDNAPEIVEMYSDCSKITYGMNYSASSYYEGSEAMFFSEKLLIPDVESPTKPETLHELVNA
jgi:DNA adenine methylase